jgi:exodeoxyribonuclease-3
VGVFAREAAWVSAKPLTGFYHAALQVRLQFAGAPLSVVGAHLCPFGAQNRLAEAEILANEAKPDEPVLLMGDLNALSPLDETTQTLAAMSPHRKARHRGRSGQADTRAVELLMEAGFIDVADRLQVREMTYPTSLRAQLGKPPVRIDYVLSSAQLAQRARSFRVVLGEQAERASDHYAVVAEFESLAG